MIMKEPLTRIVNESQTPAGKLFDIGLMGLILCSVVITMLDSLPSLTHFDSLFSRLEWFFTSVFTLEYGIRIWLESKPKRYIFSFFGIIDLLAILPSYMGLLLTGGQHLVAIRLLRVLRVFRILKLVKFTREGRMLLNGLKGSFRKISIFLFTVVILVIILGSIMYSIEGGSGNFSTIPKSIYWAVVTLTTVGYGDIVPTTSFGQFIASIIMLFGYGIIAVPAGIVTTELSQQRLQQQTLSCPSCQKSDLDPNSRYYHHCGMSLGT